MSKITSLVHLAFKSLALHKLRSFLTALGIIFGVASVITMLAVGEGASEEAQNSIRELGSNNIIIESVKKEDAEADVAITSYGITYEDLDRIDVHVEGIVSIVRQRIYDGPVRFVENSQDANIIACDHDIFKAQDIKIISGRALCSTDSARKNNVCVIDQTLVSVLFPYQDPLAHKVSYKGSFYQVVGISKNHKKKNTIYLPFTTAILNYGELTTKVTKSTRTIEEVNIHKLILRFDSTDSVYSADKRINRIFKYSHNTEDYTVQVPIQLLEKAEETKKIFNLLLGSIAGISLLVGGIGIMNIMLATVSERTKEIGLRRAIGAKKKDIVLQFMTEAVVLSLAGGVLGVIAGVLLPALITHFSGIPTILSPVFVILSFVISGMTGIIFGSYPAIKSANLSPIEALRDV